MERSNGNVLRYFDDNKKTKENCLKAIIYSQGISLRWIKNHDNELRLFALKYHPEAIKFIQNLRP